jgi:protein-tyrosine phosphatase
MTVRVLFVCLGNICRSPMAEAVFRHLVEQAGLSDQILVDSAGTSDYHIGERAHPGTRAVLRDNGIEYEGRARQITPADFEQFDYILAMDNENLADLRRMAPPETRAVIRRFLDFADGVSIREVPDPYYYGQPEFEYVYRLVRRGAEGLLAHIRAEKGL